MCKASFRTPSLTYRRPMIPSKTRPCEDQHFSESDFEAHENCLTSLIIAYICSGALGSRELPHSGGHLHEARPPEHPGEKDLKDIVHDVGNNVPGQTTAAYNLLKQKVRRYCRENNVKFSYWLTVNDVGDTRPSEAHTTPTKEILKHWTTDEVLRSQAKNSAPTTGDLTSDIYPVFTIPQCLSVIDQRTRMQIGKEGGKANELSSEVEMSRHHPRCPIICVTRTAVAARQLHLYRVYHPIFYGEPPTELWAEDMDLRIACAIDFGRKRKFLNDGDNIIVVTGFKTGSGATNSLCVI
ncbi:unnamed protein product [Schistocephalus solidus]|uniref:PK_C domain-containing protein n=1 Tax=Schistocephalus solidus TaxID=70667 RepID=A0A183SA76_SCHSO|nr:unnamed protein product [Schistocephalus solidus]